MRAKQYRGDVKAMLVVWSNTITQIQDMGGDVSDSNYHKDFWDAVTSHDENMFSIWVEDRFSTYMALRPNMRPSLDDEIKAINKQQTLMEARGK